MRIDFSFTASAAADGCRRLAILIVLLAPAVGVAQLAPDPAFGNAGKVTTSIVSFTGEGARALAVDAQSRVLVAYSGTAFGISRHNADGSLDSSFGVDGVRGLGFYPSDVLLQNDGKIIAVGTSVAGGDWQVARLLADGTLDSSFATAGILTYSTGGSATSVALDSAGHIIVGGQASIPGRGIGFALLYLNTSGNILYGRADDVSSNAADYCQKLVVQSDSKVICAGFSRSLNGSGAALMVAVRYLPNFQIDTSYGTNGVAAVAFGTNPATTPAEAYSAILLDSGAMILGGGVNSANGYNLAMTRLTASGTLDTSFGIGGRVERPIAGSISELIRGMLLFQGSLFVTASTSYEAGDFALLRFDTDGTANTSFGTSGLAVADFHGNFDSSYAMAVHQGAVLVGGSVGALAKNESSNIGLARFLPTGGLDMSFSGDGLSETSLRGPVNAESLGAVRQSDGKIVAVGKVGISTSDRDFAVARYMRDGSLDSSFGQQGIVTTDFANDEDAAVAITAQNDGRLLVAGTVRIPPATRTDMAIARYTATGALDSSFGVGGKVTIDVDGNTDTGRAISVQNDGKILLAGDSTFPSLGNSQNLTVVRLMADGSRDTTFGNNGVANASIGTYDFGNALAVQSDGKILIGGIGNANFAIARFLTNGTRDNTFGSSGIVTFDFAGQYDDLRDLLVLPNWNGQGERLLAVGSAFTTSSASSQQFAAAMFDLNGNLETGFGTGGMVMVDLMPGQADVATKVARMGNRLVLAGYSTLNAQTDFAMLGLTMDGAADTSFTVDGSAIFVDYFASTDQANSIVIGSQGDVVLVGSAFDPTRGFSGKMFALARFSDGDRIFSNGFDTF